MLSFSLAFCSTSSSSWGLVNMDLKGPPFPVVDVDGVSVVSVRAAVVIVVVGGNVVRVVGVVVVGGVVRVTVCCCWWCSCCRCLCSCCVVCGCV